MEFSIFINGMGVTKIKANSLTRLSAECNLCLICDS